MRKLIILTYLSTEYYLMLIQDPFLLKMYNEAQHSNQISY